MLGICIAPASLSTPRIVRVAVLALCLLTVPGASGDVVFDNLSGTNAQTGFTFGAHTSYAQKFTSGTGGIISSVSLNLFNNTPNPFVGLFGVSIYNTGSQGPGTLAFDYHLAAENGLGTLGGAPITFVGNQSSSSTPLQAGTTYWLVVQRSVSATNGASLDWAAGDNAQGGAGQNYMSLTIGGTWTEISGFPQGFGAEIVTVPEPATCAIALAGLACGGFSVWRRRRHGSRHPLARTQHRSV